MRTHRQEWMRQQLMVRFDPAKETVEQLAANVYRIGLAKSVWDDPIAEVAFGFASALKSLMALDVDPTVRNDLILQWYSGREGAVDRVRSQQVPADAEVCAKGQVACRVKFFNKDVAVKEPDKDFVQKEVHLVAEVCGLEARFVIGKQGLPPEVKGSGFASTAQFVVGLQGLPPEVNSSSSASTAQFAVGLRGLPPEFDGIISRAVLM